MTTVAVLCDPPREGVLPELAATTPLTRAECADLYGAMCADVFRAVEDSAAELLVNVRSDDDGELRALVDSALERPDEVRFEPQVGSTFDGRVGNTLTHLLETESETAVFAIEPTTPFLTRGAIDGMAMKLRRSDVILGPTSNGRVYAAGFSAAIDFANAYAAPAITTLTDRARDAGLDVDYAPMLPVLETHTDLVGALALIEARERAGREVPTHTADRLSEFERTLMTVDGELELSRPDTDND